MCLAQEKESVVEVQDLEQDELVLQADIQDVQVELEVPVAAVSEADLAVEAQKVATAAVEDV